MKGKKYCRTLACYFGGSHKAAVDFFFLLGDELHVVENVSEVASCQKVIIVGLDYFQLTQLEN